MFSKENTILLDSHLRFLYTYVLYICICIIFTVFISLPIKSVLTVSLQSGCTPLNYAVAKNHGSTAKYLIYKANADGRKVLQVTTLCLVLLYCESLLLTYNTIPPKCCLVGANYLQMT